MAERTVQAPEIPVEQWRVLMPAAFSGVLVGLIKTVVENFGDKGREVMKDFILKQSAAYGMFRNLFAVKGRDAITFGTLLLIDSSGWRAKTEVVEQSPTKVRIKITECPIVTAGGTPEICGMFEAQMAKAARDLNPKLHFYYAKKMTAGDPYCEKVVELEE